MHDYDVVVIGAGQAGLATGHELGRAPLSYVLLEADGQVGCAWSHYYASLTLFSPARFCSLPGLRMPGDPGRYPTRDETVAYLRYYAQHFAIPGRTGAVVHRVQRDAAPGWAIELTTGEVVTARAVVAATGGYRNPYRPRIDGDARYGGTVLHVADYRTPEPFTGQRVVVVGAGNSAIQVAHELAQVTEVTLATRSPVSLRHSRPLGIDLHYWVAWSGIDRLPLGRRAGTSVGVLDDGTYAAALASGRPDRREMFTGFTDDGVRWPDGSTEPVDVVIFATGYRPDLGYLPASAFGGDGWPLHRRGVSSTQPSLGFVGLPGQTGLASATLRGVGPDARRVVRNLVAPLRRGSAAAPSIASVADPA